MTIPLVERKEDALPVGAIIATARSDMARRQTNECGPPFEPYAFHRLDVIKAISPADLIARAIVRFKKGPGKDKKTGRPKRWPKRSMRALAIDLDRLQEIVDAAQDVNRGTPGGAEASAALAVRGVS